MITKYWPFPRNADINRDMNKKRLLIKKNIEFSQVTHIVDINRFLNETHAAGVCLLQFDDNN